MSNEIDDFFVEVGLRDRDRISLKIELESDKIVNSVFEFRGCPRLLQRGQEFRRVLNQLIGQSIAKIVAPTEGDHVSVLIRELIHRLQGEWQPPYNEKELCHCRQVSLYAVDAAVISGAKAVQAVSRKTSAGTGCGTCRPDIKKILDYRRPAKG